MVHTTCRSMIASNGPGGGSAAGPTTNVRSTPFASAFARAFDSMPSERSSAVTTYPSSAASRLNAPVPAPASSTFAPRSGNARRSAARHAAASSGSEMACEAESSYVCASRSQNSRI